MPEENIIWTAFVFGTILLLAMGGVVISFLFLYQRKKHRHQQEVTQIQETFNREMLYSKTEIQEQTLQHIATEIHDNFTPTLSFINLNLASVVPIIDNPAKEKVTDAKTLLKQVMAEMKALSISLDTGQISKIGFVQAFQDHVERLRKTGYYNITVSKQGEEYRLSPNKELILFRMCQEVLNNIVKHADAKTIIIHLVYGKDAFNVEITDDGKGFDTAGISTDPNKQDSTGLRNLKNRALALNAALTIKSQPGEGTTITISSHI